MEYNIKPILRKNIVQYLVNSEKSLNCIISFIILKLTFNGLSTIKNNLYILHRLYFIHFRRILPTTVLSGRFNL